MTMFLEMLLETKTSPITLPSLELLSGITQYILNWRWGKPGNDAS